MVSVKGGYGLGKSLDDIKAGLAKAKRVRVGFTEQAKYANGTPVATAAAAANFGSPANGEPPRPFFTNAVNDNRDRWGKLLARELKRADYDAYLALARTGELMARDIAKSLVATSSPALSPVTLLLRERFSDPTMVTFADVMQARHDIAAGKVPSLSGTGAEPLVWSGVMLQTLQGPGAYEVEV